MEKFITKEYLENNLKVYNNTIVKPLVDSVVPKPTAADKVLLSALKDEKPIWTEVDKDEVGGGSGLPKPESKDKLLLSAENAETSEIEWTQVDKVKAIEIPLYETKAAAEADIANLSDGQIIGTKDEGNENANPVDVVQNGNMHAVTSNAVANYVDGKALYKKATKDLSNGWNYFIMFEGLKAGTYVITTTVDAIVNDINAVVDGAFTQIGVAGNKNGTLIMDIANDVTDMTIAVYTNTVTSGVTLRAVLMKVA